MVSVTLFNVIFNMTLSLTLRHHAEWDILFNVILNATLSDHVGCHILFIVKLNVVLLSVAVPLFGYDCKLQV